MHLTLLCQSIDGNIDFDAIFVVVFFPFRMRVLKEFRTNVSHAEWTYRFPRHSHKNLNKTYKMDVSVGQWYIFFAYPMASKSLEINVTGMWETLFGFFKEISQLISIFLSDY